MDRPIVRENSHGTVGRIIAAAYSRGMRDCPGDSTIGEIDACIGLLDHRELKRHVHSIPYDEGLRKALANAGYLVRSFYPEASDRIDAFMDHMDLGLFTALGLRRRLGEIRQSLGNALLRAHRLHDYPDIRLEEERAPTDRLPVD
jgi:hypothetical protein